MEMEDEGDESKADYYGDILNRFESRLAKVQGQLDDYDMNESKDIKEGDENLFKPRIVKDKNNPNFLLIHINYPTGAGALVALGKETMSGQQRREGAIKAMKMGNVIAKKLESKYNLEDIEVSDGENGKVTVFAVSDDFINMKSPSIDEKLTKSSSVEDHIDDFKDSDAKQFKGKSDDKKVQMAVASFLSKKNVNETPAFQWRKANSPAGDTLKDLVPKKVGTSTVQENMVADKDIEKEIKKLEDENPKGFEKEIKKLKVRQAALKLSK
jgi:hypothetical protein